MGLRFGKVELQLDMSGLGTVWVWNIRIRLAKLWVTPFFACKPRDTRNPRKTRNQARLLQIDRICNVIATRNRINLTNLGPLIDIYEMTGQCDAK